MNFRYLLLAAVLGLSACNGSDTSTNKKEADSTFSDVANAVKQLGDLNAQLDAGKKAIAEATQDLSGIKDQRSTEEKRRDELKTANDAAVAAAEKRLRELTEANDEAVAAAEKRLGELAEAERTKAVDLARAQSEYEALVGKDGTSTTAGKIFDETKKFDGLKTGVVAEQGKLDAANDSLDSLLGKDRKKTTEGKIFEAQKELDDLIRTDPENLGRIAKKQAELQALQDDVTSEQGKVASAKNELTKLLGGDLTGKTAGLVFDVDQKLAKLKLDAATEEAKLNKAKKDLDDLVREDLPNPGEIAKARKLRDDLKAEGEKLLSDARKDAARILAKASADAGRFDDAGKFLTDAGLNDEAIELYKKAGKIDKAAVLLTAAGKLEDAYKLYAPEDKAITDPNPYGAATYGSVTFDKVDESPSVKHHSMQLGDKTVWFTAKAGHLVAYAQKDKNNPDAKRDPQAAVFYMSYTRDDMPKENRPVTFFFNGGPGESSIWLHLGAWAPWRLKVDQPNVPTDAKSGPPKSYPFVGNPETLLDKSDLVFVDPIGSGYSQAISSDVKKHINKDFWGVDADAKIMRDFVTRYINVNNRQSSPKYLYGESYGGGIRVPVLTKLLIDAGTTGFEEDKSDRPPVVLTGSTLHSPILDYGSNCSTGGGSSCAGYVPTYVLTSDFFGQSTERDKNRPYSEFVDRVRTFAREKHTGAITEFLKSGDAWAAYKNTAEGRAYLGEVVRLTGITATKLSEKLPDKSWTITTYTNLWEKLPNVVVGKCEPDRKQNDGYMNALKPGFSFNLYDTRMVVQGSVPYDFEYSEDDAFKAEMKKFLPKYLNYTNNAEYIASAELTNKELKNFWDWGTNREGVEKTKTSTLSDITMALNTAPKLKLIVTHGYFDAATPFFQTELDLDAKVKVNGSDIKLSDRIPVYNFEGGHMIYYVEKERPALKRAMDDFYDAPPYSPPTVASVQKSAAVQ
ncbi:S10 family serine carboxypeptidase-like protein [Phyllobacterium chamaecytisi]|uniref:S10 family serine carboxypeptidase-like protein n=1 Tax=Phyllobacterium chamaecytisi TaxID=2876082 RepID=UPI001CCA805F|nr:hypothetical protein [Phyllobacterium sp. KW56]MBZ9604770.1 hypothetical protein [Phyllobacterium sp. KW56]